MLLSCSNYKESSLFNSYTYSTLKMKYKLLPLLTIAGCLLIRCNHKTKPAANQLSNTTETVSSGCYTYTTPKDTVLLLLNHNDGVVTGDLIYNYFEKDKNTGTIKGRFNGDTLFADYTFMSESVESVREVAFLKRGNSFQEGFGEVTEQSGKMVFKNKSRLNFNNNAFLTKGNCKQSEHGCYTDFGYTWSGMLKACVLLTEVATRLAPTDANIQESAYIIFSDDQQKVELYLPGTTAPVLLLRKGTEDNHYWENKDLKLYPWKGYVLKQNGKNLYFGQ